MYGTSNLLVPRRVKAGSAFDATVVVTGADAGATLKVDLVQVRGPMNPALFLSQPLTVTSAGSGTATFAGISLSPAGDYTLASYVTHCQSDIEDVRAS